MEQWLKIKLKAVQSIQETQDKIAIAKALCAIFNIEISEADLIDDIMMLCHQQNNMKSNKRHFGHNTVNSKPRTIGIKIEQFIACDDGTFLDTQTKLMWCRYSVGQRWINGEYEGEAKTMTWGRAMMCASAFNQQGGCGGFTDWRLPTIDEWLSLAPIQEDFPIAPETGYWSSTPFHNPNCACYVYFTYENYTAISNSTRMDNFLEVRLVRTSSNLEISEAYLSDVTNKDLIDKIIASNFQQKKRYLN